MQIERVPITELKIWEDNPRDIEPDNLQALKERLTLKGQYKPLLINQNNIVLGGNMRLRAMRELDWKAPVDVIKVETKDEGEMLWFALVDNEQAGHYKRKELAQLAVKYPQLAGIRVDLQKSVRICTLIDRYTQTNQDSAPGVSINTPQSQLGEIYQLGPHRLMCGDATKFEDVAKLMDGKKADMAFTDPPYGMGFDGSVHATGEKSYNAGYDDIANDQNTLEATNLFLDKFLNNLKIFSPGPFYITYWRLGVDIILNALTRNKLKWRNLIIWKKNNFNLSNSDYKSQYEPIVYGWAKQDIDEVILYGWDSPHYFYGEKGEHDIWEVALPNIWEIDRTAKNSEHPTMKPVALCARAIKNSSKQGDIVLDLFGGSGSTLIAAEQLGRVCYIMELEPKYCDVIRNRYKQYIEKVSNNDNEKGGM